MKGAKRIEISKPDGLSHLVVFRREGVQYPTVYDADGNKIEIEVRCAVCLRGLCEGAVAVKLKKRKGMWGIFVPLCKTCRLDIEQGRQPTIRHDRRQIDTIENCDYEGFEFE